MLKSEDITKTEELKGKFKKIWLSSDYIQKHLNILGFDSIQAKFDSCKKAGHSFGSLISTLLMLPLLGIGSVNELQANKDKALKVYGKDSYYRLLANQSINWRSFLFRFVKRYLAKD
ncbi:MAG: IS4 family transposase, partial [Polaribacter sp.]